MKAPRGLSAEEAALWARLARTVTPLAGKVPPPPVEGDRLQAAGAALAADPPMARKKPPVALPPAAARSNSPTRPAEERLGLDAAWERKLSRAAIEPDFTLDLHGHTLEQAHRRLDIGLGQAKAMGARLVLLITGKAPLGEAADRGVRRGAIRATVLDWLAAGPHGADIAAIRPAHRRHGGPGALYLVLRRSR